jgi:hypothetical protein
VQLPNSLDEPTASASAEADAADPLPACQLLAQVWTVLDCATGTIAFSICCGHASSEEVAGSKSRKWRTFVEALEKEAEEASTRGVSGGETRSDDEVKLASSRRDQPDAKQIWISGTAVRRFMEGPEQMSECSSRGQEGRKTAQDEVEGDALTAEEKLQVAREAAAHAARLADLTLVPMALRQALQALRPLLKAAHPASTIEGAAYALASVLRAFSQLEPFLVGHGLPDKPWFAAFLLPKCETRLCDSWKTSGVVELFELLGAWAELPEDWAAVSTGARLQVLDAIGDFACLPPTFSVDALHFVGAEKMPSILSGVTAALRFSFSKQGMLKDRDENEPHPLEAVVHLVHKYPRIVYSGLAKLEEMVSRCFHEIAVKELFRSS